MSHHKSSDSPNDVPVTTVTVTDRRLHKISRPMLYPAFPLNSKEDIRVEEANVVRITNFDLSDGSLAGILQQRDLRKRRGSGNPDDRLRAFAVRAVVWMFIVSVIALLAIAGIFAVEARGVPDAAEPLGKILGAAGTFLKVVFGGSLLVLVISAIFTRKSPRWRREEDRRPQDHHDDSSPPG